MDDKRLLPLLSWPCHGFDESLSGAAAIVAARIMEAAALVGIFTFIVATLSATGAPYHNVVGGTFYSWLENARGNELEGCRW